MSITAPQYTILVVLILEWQVFHDTENTENMEFEYKTKNTKKSWKTAFLGLKTPQNKKYFAVLGLLVSPAVAVCG